MYQEGNFGPFLSFGGVLGKPMWHLMTYSSMSRFEGHSAGKKPMSREEALVCLVSL